MKILVGLMVAVVVIGGGVTAAVIKYRSGGKSETTAVRVEKVSRGDLVEIVSAPGQVQPKTKVQISARVAARIGELPFDEGQRVTRSDVLVRLDATEMEAQLRATQARAAGQKAQREESAARILAQEAQIEASRILLLDAQRDAKRQKELLTDGDVAVREQLLLSLRVALGVEQQDARRLDLRLLRQDACGRLLALCFLPGRPRLRGAELCFHFGGVQPHQHVGPGDALPLVERQLADPRRHAGADLHLGLGLDLPRRADDFHQVAARDLLDAHRRGFRLPARAVLDHRRRDPPADHDDGHHQTHEDLH